MANQIYYIELFAQKCIVEIIANGLFLTRSNAKNGSSINYPLNTELIGKNNSIQIKAYPTLLDSGVISTYKDITISGTVKKYSPTDIISPESGTLIVSFDFADELYGIEVELFSGKQITAIFPITKNLIFDNDDISFRQLFLEFPIINDKENLLDYGEHIRDLIANKDLEKFYPEYLPKLQDYKKAYASEQFDDLTDFFVKFWEGDFLPGDPITNFKRDDIGLRSWCGGRIWELFVKPDKEFFTNKGADGDINTIEMYVGKVDGNLKIVR